MEDQVGGLALEFVHAEKDQLDCILTRVSVLIACDFRAARAAYAEFLFQFARKRLFGSLTGLHLAAGKFPLERMGLFRCPAANQDAPLPLNDRRHHLNHANIGAQVYPERLIEHFQNPRNVGELPPPAVTVEVSNPACGDILRLAARFEAGVAVEVRYKVRGCTASIAAGSALTEWLTGKTPEQIARFTPAVVDEAVGGLAAESKHAAVLCADAVKALLRVGR
jgi:nitrogen fixation protein NifU and related proteins